MMRIEPAHSFQTRSCLCMASALRSSSEDDPSQHLCRSNPSGEKADALPAHLGPRGADIGVASPAAATRRWHSCV
ncbi:uncharacterized protein LAESUDRAFT_722729 [Laetiporus sulphureus 93-53]|uniref:Uncharacterized protein n=1 Tax=Laetiporus sulphureus 93-53 TaxID=1314785 RepID=A0A165G2J8_9APHY|nr:uncharacterized protein LAESUDRAFT_722729 [Laetiporus sulphureus 93-53]KZT09745.1 hypothetical protein LAESUDRAFT_722729 [Laetiporus sulphureus 93-53]